jgi:hypothetical protein
VLFEDVLRARIFGPKRAFNFYTAIAIVMAGLVPAIHVFGRSLKP